MVHLQQRAGLFFFSLWELKDSLQGGNIYMSPHMLGYFFFFLLSCYNSLFPMLIFMWFCPSSWAAHITLEGRKTHSSFGLHNGILIWPLAHSLCRFIYNQRFWVLTEVIVQESFDIADRQTDTHTPHRGYFCLNSVHRVHKLHQEYP